MKKRVNINHNKNRIFIEGQCQENSQEWVKKKEKQRLTNISNNEIFTKMKIWVAMRKYIQLKMKKMKPITINIYNMLNRWCWISLGQELEKYKYDKISLKLIILPPIKMLIKYRKFTKEVVRNQVLLKVEIEIKKKSWEKKMIH